MSASGIGYSLTRLSVVTTATEGLLAAASVLSTAYVVRRLGTEQYGIIALVTVLAGQFSLLQLGAAPAAMRRLAACRARGDMNAYAATRHAAMGYGLATSLLAMAAAALTVRWAFGGGLHVSSATAALADAAVVPAIIVLGLQPLARAVGGILQGQERLVALVAVRLLQGLGSIGAMVLAVMLGGSAAVVLWTSAATGVVAVLLSVRAARVPDAPRVRWRDVWSALRALTALGLPFAAVAVLSGMLVDVEKLAIALTRSVEDFTYYTVPFGAMLRLSTLASAFGVLLSPRLARLAEAGEVDGARALTRQATGVSLTALTIAVVPMLAVTRELLTVWVGADFAARATLPTRILLVALLVNVAAYAASAALLARAHPRVVTRLYVLEVPLHLGVVVLLVSRWGIVGAACAWAARVVIDTLAHWWLARRTLEGPVAGTREVAMVAGAVLAAALYELIDATVAWRASAAHGRHCRRRPARLAAVADGVCGSAIGRRRHPGKPSGAAIGAARQRHRRLMHAAEPVVSITIVAYNSGEQLPDCLSAIRPALRASFAELIVVDNASPDDSATIVARQCPEALLLRSTSNRGFAGGCNLAWSKVRGRYWLLLNPDVVPPPDGIGQLVEWLDRRPEFGAASPQLIGTSGELHATHRRFPSVWRTAVELVSRAPGLRRGPPHDARAAHECEADWIPGAAMLIRREAVERAGLMSEAFFMYGEDVEWCWRIRRAGFRIGVAEAIRFRHAAGGSAIRTWGERQWYERMWAGWYHACRLTRGRLHGRALLVVSTLALAADAFLAPRGSVRQRAARRDLAIHLRLLRGVGHDAEAAVAGRQQHPPRGDRPARLH